MNTETTVRITEEIDDIRVRVSKVDDKFDAIYLHGGAPSMNFIVLHTNPKNAARTLRKIADFLETLS